MDFASQTLTVEPTVLEEASFDLCLANKPLRGVLAAAQRNLARDSMQTIRQARNHLH